MEITKESLIAFGMKEVGGEARAIFSMNKVISVGEDTMSICVTNVRNASELCLILPDGAFLYLKAESIEDLQRFEKCIGSYESAEKFETMTELEQMNAWLQTGDRGVSSETIFSVLSGVKIARKCGHPYDPADFFRCYQLLKAVPAWRARIGEMANVSQVWVILVENWDELEVLAIECEKMKFRDKEWLDLDSKLFYLGAKTKCL